MTLRMVLNYRAAPPALRRMPMTLTTFAALLGCLGSAAAAPLGAQEHPARRLSSIVGVAVEEYAKGVDAGGRLVSALEYQEAVDFLADARGVADRLPGDRAAARAVLDSMIAAVAARGPPASVAALRERFVASLGPEGALELPGRPTDLAAGRAVYDRSCASCHGALGRGDGPAARGMDPAPPAVGTAQAMADVSPATAFRVISVGVKGTPMTGWAERLSVDDRWNVVAYLTSLRHPSDAAAEGEGLFLQQCAGCHGALGAGDGPLTKALSKLPPELTDFGWQAEHSDAQLAAAVRNGLPGTPMPPARDLADTSVAKVVAYLRTLPARAGGPPAALAGAGEARDAAGASRQVLAMLDEALGHARGGRASEAGDRAFDAYLAFEPIESPARARSPGLVASMERHFADFRGAVRGSDLRAAERARDAIAAGLPAVVDLTRPADGAWGAFLQSFLIIVREGFEAILVVGAVVAFLIKTGNRNRLRSIWTGVAAALAASVATAVALKTLLAAMPATREIIEGATMLVAVAVLFSVSYWLISKVEAARWQQFIREKVGSALQQGGGAALALVAFLAVYREGAETALFYQALFHEGARMLPLLLGVAAGFGVLAIVFTAFYRYGVRIPLRPFFAVTSVLLYYMAFVFAGKGIRELQEGNAIPITTIPGLPQVDALGIFPTVETLLAQLVLVALFAFALVKTFWPRRVVTLPTVAAGQSVAAEQLAALVEANARLQARVAALEAAVAARGRAETQPLATADRHPSPAR